MTRGFPELRGLERRLALAYLSAFAAVLLACIAAAHASLVLTLRAGENARLTELIREARGAYVAAGGSLHIDSDGPQLFNLRSEGVIWYDRSGRIVAAEGIAPPEGGRASRARIGDELVRRAPTAHGYVRVATETARDADFLRHSDEALALGSLAALVLASIGGLLLARRAIARARATVRAMRDFTADAAHELRGPLAAIRGNAQASIRDASDLPAAQARRLANIDATARSMACIVDDLLLLARAEGTSSTELYAVDVAARVAAVVAARTELATQTGVALCYPAGGRAIAYGDPSEIERIVANLVDNALRHTPRGGSVDLACQRSRAGLTVVVRDSGVGIAETDLARIFERFWRGDPARGHGAGSGLGLAIARALARRHGGEVTVASLPGTGSTFTLELPARPPRSQLDAFD